MRHEAEIQPIRILLRRDVCVYTHAGEELVLKGRKVNALMAVLCLSPDGLVPRQRVANLLWSAREPSVRLARLRDLVHEVKSYLGRLGADVLDVSNDKIGFRAGCVKIEYQTLNDSAASDNAASNFLTDLDGVDPAFDQWIISVRLQRANVLINERGHGWQEPEPGSAITERCTIAVTEIIADLHGAELASGMLDEIRQTLTRLRWFSTITRDNKGQTLRIGDQDLASLADYALVCTLSSSSNEPGLFVELVASGHDRRVIWAERLDFDEQTGRTRERNLAEKIAARIDTEILLAEVTRHNRSTPTNDRSAYHFVLRAIPAILQLERDKFVNAGHLLEQAIEADPNSAFAHSWLAYWYIFLVGQGWAHNPLQAMTRAGRAADRAMILDPKEARGFTVAGHVRAFIGRRLGEASALHEIALRLNPSLPLAWHLAGMTSAYAGRLDEAHSRIERCRALAQEDPITFFSEGALAIVHLLKHQHEQSALIGQRVTQRHPNFTSAYKSTISALGHLGEKAEAQLLIQRLRRLDPNFSLRTFQVMAPYRNRENLAHFMAGLRLAGVT